MTGDLLLTCVCPAVIYEALMAIVSTHADDALLSVASKCIGRFLLSKSANLQYIGNCFCRLTIIVVYIADNILVIFC